MKVVGMLGDIAGSLIKRPVTEQYPFVRREAPVRLRGALVWNRLACSGCRLCTMDCPAEAIDVMVLDKASKRFVMRYSVDRCTFCGQCVTSCKQDALEMSSDQWELAAADRDAFLIEFGDPSDVAEAAARAVAAGTDPDAGAA
jgi:formate hydrogenlyase subunit 6/NADH:ubiquinone oxidoreductase subunit I